MSKTMKWGVGALATISLLLTGCVSSGSPSAPAASGGAAKAGSSVVSIVAGSLGDQSFFDDAQRGIEALAKEGHKTQTVQADDNNPVQWKTNLQSVSGKWDYVVTGSPTMTDIMTAVAPKYPNQKYIFYDGNVTAPNVASVQFKQNEGSFLAGALAALVTTNKAKFPNATGGKVVGLVGGMDIPVINDFVAGYKKGVETVDPSIKVLVSYTGSFSDAQKGYDQAKSMFNQGADVVFQVAGGAGTGVLKAAKEANRYAIGVDSNQNAIQPGTVLASMLKNVGHGIEDAVKAADAGTLKWGAATWYGLANDGVKLTFDNNSNLVPQDIQDQVNGYAKKVVDGSITVPTTLG